MSNIKLPLINKVLLTGTLVHDPEFKYTSKKVPVVNFLLMINYRYRNFAGEWHEKNNYIRIMARQRLAEVCKEHLKSGCSVFIEGELQNDHSEESEEEKLHQSIEVRASRIQLLTQSKEILSEDDDSTNEVCELIIESIAVRSTLFARKSE